MLNYAFNQFHSIKKRLCSGMRNVNSIQACLHRTTILISNHSHKVANLLPKMFTFRVTNNEQIDQDGHFVSRLIILMQKHNMQLPNMIDDFRQLIEYGSEEHVTQGIHSKF